jgi:ADP-heptose:LPS heptosyltransferase
MSVRRIRPTHAAAVLGVPGPLGLGDVNIVVVVAGGLTETLQAAPLLAALATATDEPLLFACAPAAADVARGLAGADEVLPVPGLAAGAGPAGLGGLWFELRRRRLDAALICSERASLRAAVYTAAVPRRIGCAGGLSDRLLSDPVPCPRGENRARAWLRLCGPLGVSRGPVAARYTPAATAAAAAEQVLLSKGAGDGRLLVAIAPGAGFAEGAVASWGAERFAHLANRLASRHGAGVILVGDERDRPVGEAMRIDLAADSVDLCGEVDLAVTAAVIARCDLLVASDTPLLHLAAAVGTPSVGLFGPTDGRRRGPAGREHRVVQAIAAGDAPAGLERIRVDDVLAGIESTL